MTRQLGASGFVHPTLLHGVMHVPMGMPVHG